MKQYNGWPNRFTWSTHLWLTNDERTYRTVHNIVQSAPNDFAATENLKEFVGELLIGEEPIANLATDILSYVVHLIDYSKLVAAFKEE